VQLCGGHLPSQGSRRSPLRQAAGAGLLQINHISSSRILGRALWPPLELAPHLFCGRRCGRYVSATIMMGGHARAGFCPDVG